MKKLNRDKTCEVCGILGVYAKGLCQKCYKAQHWQENKDQLGEQHKRYNRDNREHIVKQQAEYRQEHKEQWSEYLRENKEHIKEQRVQYRIENKEQLSQQDRERVRFAFLGKLLSLHNHERAPKGYVYHHTCYDHADPEAYIVLMSRADHARAHATMKRLGIEIPHINQRV